MAANQTEKEDRKGRTRIEKVILIVINFILIATAVECSLLYSGKLQRAQQKAEMGRFCSTIESMKQISSNYLTLELGYAKDWSKYITGHDMTMSVMACCTDVRADAP